MDTSQKPRSLILQARDIELLRDLFESRVMTSKHICALHFEGRGPAAKNRLGRLKSSGFIRERERLMSEPAVLYITKKGLLELQARDILSEYPKFSLPVFERRMQVSKFTLQHELDVMNVKAAFHVAIKKMSAFSIVEFSTWPPLHQFEAGALVKPDGFICIHEGENDDVSEHTFFLEVDRSTESLELLVSRAARYQEYLKLGELALKNKLSRTSFRDYPFRVLMVFKTAERRNNMVERLLCRNPPILRHIYLASMDDVIRNPFGTIWIQPIDYHTVTEGTPFAVCGTLKWGYRRQVTRDIFISKHIRGISILTDVSREVPDSSLQYHLF